MIVTIFKAEDTRYLVGISEAPAQSIDVMSYPDSEGKVVTAARAHLHLERADLESLILQLSGQLAKLDQDAADKKVPA